MPQDVRWSEEENFVVPLIETRIAWAAAKLSRLEPGCDELVVPAAHHLTHIEVGKPIAQAPHNGAEALGDTVVLLCHLRAPQIAPSRTESSGDYAAAVCMPAPECGSRS